MKAINLLTQRQSTPLLTEPKPSKDSLELIIDAGMRVPDHAALKPWFFHVITGDGLKKISDLFVSSSIETEGANLEKIAKMPFRAPMIIVVSTQYKTHDKVPLKEQLITAGCCVHAMQMACVALGYGAMWRTGALAANEKVKEGLGISEQDEIVGFLYVGTPCKKDRLKPKKTLVDKVTFWQ
ncbi:MAG: NAD(P)H nitroreductase [Colwellia sp.]